MATRWYRAPEIMLNWMHYNQTGDVSPYGGTRVVLDHGGQAGQGLGRVGAYGAKGQGPCVVVVGGGVLVSSLGDRQGLGPSFQNRP